MTVMSVVMLLMGVLSVALAIYGGVVALNIFDIYDDTSQRHAIEGQYYLLTMIGMIVLSARILMAGLFFWTLESLIPFCPGAMCVYGVINAGNPFASIDSVLKVTLPFIYGTWIVIGMADKRHPQLPLLWSLTTSFLTILLPLVLLDSIMDVFVLSAIRPIFVPCCSSLYDVSPPFSPSALLGINLGPLLLTLTFLIMAGLIIMQWFQSTTRSHLVFTGSLAVMVAIIYLVTLHDTYAPMVLGLTSHHCPYCLFQEYPDIALFTVLFWIGIASVLWRVILEFIWTKRYLSKDLITDILSRLRKTSTVCLTFSLVSMLSHTLVSILVL